MVFFVLATLLSWFIDLGTFRFQSDRDKDLEILLLRRQLAILQRMQQRPPRLSRWEKLGLAVLVSKHQSLPATTRSRVWDSLRLFTPATVLRWHPVTYADICTLYAPAVILGRSKAMRSAWSSSAIAVVLSMPSLRSSLL